MDRKVSYRKSFVCENHSIYYINMATMYICQSKTKTTHCSRLTMNWSLTASHINMMATFHVTESEGQGCYITSSYQWWHDLHYHRCLTQWFHDWWNSNAQREETPTSTLRWVKKGKGNQVRLMHKTWLKDWDTGSLASLNQVAHISSFDALPPLFHEIVVQNF